MAYTMHVCYAVKNMFLLASTILSNTLRLNQYLIITNNWSVIEWLLNQRKLFKLSAPSWPSGFKSLNLICFQIADLFNILVYNVKEMFDSLTNFYPLPFVYFIFIHARSVLHLLALWPCKQEKEKLRSRIAIKSHARPAYNGNDLTTWGSNAACCCQAFL